VHIPLAQVPKALCADEIVRVGRLLAAFMHRRLGRPARIAVAGLNPHAGEKGLMGSEEKVVIAPAVRRLNRGAGGRAVFTGPWPPDTVFHRAVHGDFDAVLSMYHDQGLIPLKLYGFDEGVNVTLGLPIIRVSPDHGTGFSVAGQGRARPDSMIAALNLAAALAGGAEPGLGGRENV
jgi:4-hydroxythreonine-4-phosphate dehydrogenase